MSLCSLPFLSQGQRINTIIPRSLSKLHTWNMLDYIRPGIVGKSVFISIRRITIHEEGYSISLFFVPITATLKHSSVVYYSHRGGTWDNDAANL